MEQLLALRDRDRSEPAFAAAARHLDSCPTCRAELDALHQRTARLRALATMAPATDQFPAIRTRLHWEQSRRRRLVSLAGMAAAAALVLGIVGHDLIAPQRLDAEEQIATAISRSQELEQALHTWGPDARVMDGKMALVVIELEDRIAEVDARLQEVARLQRKERMSHEVSLWQERVGLMNALVDVHVTKANNVDL
jgi:DNA repair exonuclease SbcCD ATPase subunit